MFESLVGFTALLSLIFLRVPIAFAMILVGSIGFAWLRGWNATWSVVSTVGFDTSLSYSLSVVPLFILMGNLLTISGVSHGLYAAANRLVGGARGGLAMALLWHVAAFRLCVGHHWQRLQPCPKWRCLPCANTGMPTVWQPVRLQQAARSAFSFRPLWL